MYVIIFQDTRQQINKLSGVHTLLKRLQFLFKLPTKLNARMEEKNYSQVSKLIKYKPLHIK